MKIVILILTAINLSFSASLHGEAAPRKFIAMLADYDFPDDSFSLADDVHLVLSTDAGSYLVFVEGKRQKVPAEQAKVITSEEAAIGLLRQREILYNSLNKLIHTKFTGANPSQEEDKGNNNGLRYSQPQRSKMLLVIRRSGMISSIRNAGQLSDEELLGLYTKASEIIRLQDIQNAINRLPKK